VYRAAAALFIVTLTVSAACAGFWYYQPQIVYDKLTKYEPTLCRLLPSETVGWVMVETLSRREKRKFEIRMRDLRKRVRMKKKGLAEIAKPF